MNTGTGVDPGYRQATEPLKVFGAALGNIPVNQIDRIKTDYATVELADAANLHSTEVIGSQRGKAQLAEQAIQELEGASLSTDDRMNTHIAVLNKINAAGMMAVRASQDTNQLLVTLAEQQIAESKRQRDAEAAEIADHIAFRLNSRVVAETGVRGTTNVLMSFRMP